MIETALVKSYLIDLQDRICAALAAVDGAKTFAEDSWERPGGGGGRSRVLTEGAVFEKAGVGFSHVSGTQLPPSATATSTRTGGCCMAGLGGVAGEFIRAIRMCRPVMPTCDFLLPKNPVWLRNGGSAAATI